jgi:uncharacterized repeat protein (TIGR02543 family)
MQGTPYATVADAKEAFDDAAAGTYLGVTIEKDGVVYPLPYGKEIKIIKNGHNDFKVNTTDNPETPYYIVESAPDAHGVVTYSTALRVATVTTVPYEQKYVDFELKWVPKAQADWTTDTFDTFAEAATAALDRTGLGEHDKKFITLLAPNPVPYELAEDTQLLISVGAQGGANLKSYAEDQKIVNVVEQDFTDLAGRLVRLYSYEQLYFVTFTSEGEPFAPTQAKIFGEKAERPEEDPTPETGYTFDDWYTKDAQGELTAVYDFDAPVTADVDLFAKFTPNTYSVKFNKNNTKASGTMEDQAFTYDVEQNLTANAFTLTGQHFLGWALSARGEVVYADEAAVENLASEPDATVNLYAKWSPNDYTVTFHANNGVDPEETTTQNFTYDPATGAEGTPLNANSFTKFGFTFTGWKDGDGVSYKNKEKVNFPVENNGNVDLYAQWKEATFKLAFNGNGTEETAMTPQTVTYNNGATLKANTYTRAGYDFQGWALSDSAEKAEFTDQAELTVLQVNDLFEYGQGKTVTLYAVWSPIDYVFSYVGVEDDYVGPKGYNLDTIPEEGLPVPDPVKVGSEFTGWTLEITDDEGNKTVINNVKGDVVPAVNPRLGNRVYTANWDEINYTLTFNAKSGRVVNPATGKAVGTYTIDPIHYEDEVVWPEEPTRTGFSFAGWEAYTTDAAGEKIPVDVPFDKMPVAGNVTVEATWTVNQYTLTFYDVNPDGTVVDTPLYVITQSYKTTVDAPADPEKAHYSFVEWVDEDGTPAEVPAKMPAENMDFFATWLGDPATIIWVDDSSILWNNTTQRYGEATVRAEKHDPTILNRTKPGYGLDPEDLWKPGVSEFVAGDAIYYLNWKQVHNVDFISNGTTLKTVSVIDGKTIAAADEPTAKQGGVQAMWLINGEDGNYFVFDKTEVTSEIEYLQACWPETYAVTFIDGDKEPVVVKLAEDSSPTAVLDRAPVIEDMSFIGWFTDEDVQFTEELVGWTLKEPLTLTAKYEAFEVTFEDADGTEVDKLRLPVGSTAGEVTEAAANDEKLDAIVRNDNFEGWMDEAGVLITEIDGWTLTGATTLTAKYWAPVGTGIQWKAGTVDLQGQIKMRLKFDISDETIEKAYSVKIGQFGTVDFSDAEIDREGFYWFVVPVAIPYYSTMAKIEILDENGEAIQFLDREGKAVTSVEYSIETYVNNMKEKTSGTTLQLIEALGVYGEAAAHLWMGGPAVTPVAVNWSTIEDTVKPTAFPAGVTKMNRSVDFQSANNLIVRVFLEEGKTMDDYTWTVPSGATIEQKGSTVEITIPNIAAPYLNNRFAVSVSDGTTTATTEVSVLSYAKSMIGKNADELMLALYHYWAAAKAVWPDA